MATDQLPDGQPQQRHAVVFGLFPGDPTFYTLVERDTDDSGVPAGNEQVVAWLPPGVRHYVEVRNATQEFSHYRFRHGGFNFDPGEPTAWYRARPVQWNGEKPNLPREALLDLDLALDESDGSVDIVANGSRLVRSISWDYSLQGFPGTATTSVDTDAEGDVTVEDAFTLQPGDTGYVRVDFYSLPSSGGVLLGTLRASVSYFGAGSPSAGGQVIVNTDFSFTDPGKGSYWATLAGSTGVAVSDSPSVAAGVDFQFDNDDEEITIVQVVDDDDDITKVFAP